MPRRRGDDWSGARRAGESSAAEQARRGHAGAVDDQADQFALSERDTALAACAGDGGAGSSRCSRISRSTSRRPFELDRDRRAVVDDEDLVVVEIDVALIRHRERPQGSRQLARHAISDDDDAQRRRARGHPRESGSVGTGEVVRRPPPPEEHHASADDHNRRADHERIHDPGRRARTRARAVRLHRGSRRVCLLDAAGDHQGPLAIERIRSCAQMRPTNCRMPAVEAQLLDWSRPAPSGWRETHLCRRSRRTRWPWQAAVQRHPQTVFR